MMSKENSFVNDSPSDWHFFSSAGLPCVLQGKIRAVHDAARSGNLRQLQAALDRRKFAVAKDRRTAWGCTPLHLAVLLGQTAVVRYLAGRFPETMAARDSRGRTALHYAGTLADNGHYYNMLLNLGADRSIKDKVRREINLQRKPSIIYFQKC